MDNKKVPVTEHINFRVPSVDRFIEVVWWYIYLFIGYQDNCYKHICLDDLNIENEKIFSIIDIPLLYIDFIDKITISMPLPPDNVSYNSYPLSKYLTDDWKNAHFVINYPAPTKNRIFENYKYDLFINKEDVSIPDEIKFHDAAKTMLKSAVNGFRISNPDNLQNTINLSSAIAIMDGYTEVRAEHVAEVIQYTKEMFISQYLEKEE